MRHVLWLFEFPSTLLGSVCGRSLIPSVRDIPVFALRRIGAVMTHLLVIKCNILFPVHLFLENPFQGVFLLFFL